MYPLLVRVGLASISHLTVGWQRQQQRRRESMRFPRASRPHPPLDVCMRFVSRSSSSKRSAYFNGICLFTPPAPRREPPAPIPADRVPLLASASRARAGRHSHSRAATRIAHPRTSLRLSVYGFAARGPTGVTQIKPLSRQETQLASFDPCTPATRQRPLDLGVGVGGVARVIPNHAARRWRRGRRRGIGRRRRGRRQRGGGGRWASP